MMLLRRLSALCLALAAPAFAAVTASSPANNATVSSPVQYTASATASSCAKGVAAMGIYVNNQLAYKVNGTSLNTALTLSAGTYSTVVQEWDNCGGATNTPVNITVAGSNPTPPPTPPSPPPTQSGVIVTAPANGSTVGSPVAFSATASTTACAKGVAAMGIYVGGTLKYQVNGATLSTSLAFANGSQSATVQEWDYCGGALKTVTSFTVGSASATTVSLNASPSSVTSGGSSTLTVSASNATAVTLAGSDGSSYTLSPTGGSQVVKPTATTTYTATATGSAGNVTATTTVTVGAAAATVTVSASPASISSGGSSTLTVTATNATSVVLSGSDGSSYTLSPTGGSQVVKPAATTTYTATATGSAGNVTATTTVTVGAAAATVSVSASPASISSGGSSTLTVTATNATSVVLSGSDGSSYTLSPTGGSQSVSPTATATYTATAGSATGNVTATATVTVASSGSSTVSLVTSPGQLAAGGSSTITVTAANATGVVLTGTDGSSYTLSSTGGTQTVIPSATTTYTATATSGSASTTATKTITVTSLAGLSKVNHVVFMLQENHSFDNYFGMLNPYRVANGFNVGLDGNTYTVDGIDDKLTHTSNSNDEGTAYAPFKFTSTCVDDMTSSWLESYGDVSRYDFTPKRGIVLDGFVHTAENYAKTCAASNGAICSGTFSDLNGKRAMGYYDQGFLNYYYYMASQYAVSDRWFSPISSKSKPNRIATFTGGTTLGLVFDPGLDDHLQQLQTSSIFQQLDQQKVGWKIYYTVTQGSCTDPTDCQGNAAAQYPATNFGYISYSTLYLYENPNGAACMWTTVPSSAVGDKSNSFCIDPNHIAPLSTYYSDLKNGTLPAFSFIEAGYGNNDEHPGSGQSILQGQQQVATVINAFTGSSAYKDSVFFLSYDEGGGPYDHVPPVPGHSNDYTDYTLGSTSASAIPDISTISVNPDSYNPCVPSTGTPMLHCDLVSADPGAHPTDAASVSGFAAQLGFRVPNMIISPFVKPHYVGHNPMDHTAILKFVENRFIGPNAYITARDQTQPTLMDFFDFNNVPWATPPTPPTPVSPATLGYNPCTPTTFAP